MANGAQGADSSSQAGGANGGGGGGFGAALAKMDASFAKAQKRAAITRSHMVEGQSKVDTAKKDPH